MVDYFKKLLASNNDQVIVVSISKVEDLSNAIASAKDSTNDMLITLYKNISYSILGEQIKNKRKSKTNKYGIKKSDTAIMKKISLGTKKTLKAFDYYRNMSTVLKELDIRLKPKLTKKRTKKDRKIRRKENYKCNTMKFKRLVLTRLINSIDNDVMKMNNHISFIMNSCPTLNPHVKEIHFPKKSVKI